MPKFGAHIIFTDTAWRRRPDIFPDARPGATFFGAVGPDTTLFMFDPVTHDSSLRKGFDSVLFILEQIDKIKEVFERVKAVIAGPPEDLADWLTGGVSRDLSYFANTALEALFLATKLGIAWNVGRINVKNPIFSRLQQLPQDFITDPVHAAQVWVIGTNDNVGFPFRMFGHPYTSDGTWKQPVPPGDYSEWWWMDLLHYRRTGDFARELIRTASTPAQTSYARGYMTHVAGDITGHPFINRIVQGPFRNHAYRHFVLETIADTWLWQHAGRGDILDARLDKLIEVEEDELDEVLTLLLSAMRTIYKPPMVPSLLGGGYPARAELSLAYRLLRKYLELSTKGSVKRPTPPPDSVAEVWNELKRLLQNNTPGRPPQWNGNVVDFLTAVLSWFAKGLILIAMLATLPAAVLARLIAVAPRWVIYLFNLAVYYLVSAIRTMVCLSGWGYCGSEDIENFFFMEPLITAGPWENGTYPAETVPNPKLPFYWLASPKWPFAVEQPSTLALAPTQAKLMPDWMISPSNMIDPSLLAVLRQLDHAASPAQTRQLYSQIAASNGFGNAVDFSIALLSGDFPVPNLDLDGDRGYGYRPWEGPLSSEHYV